MKFVRILFAETESLWSQRPVTREFLKSYSIRPRYSTFKHFRVGSASDEMKYVPRMLTAQPAHAIIFGTDPKKTYLNATSDYK